MIKKGFLAIIFLLVTNSALASYSASCLPGGGFSPYMQVVATYTCKQEGGGVCSQLIYQTSGFIHGVVRLNWGMVIRLRIHFISMTAFRVRVR